MYLYLFLFGNILRTSCGTGKSFYSEKNSTQIKRLSFLKNNDFLSITPRIDLLIENPTFFIP